MGMIEFLWAAVALVILGGAAAYAFAHRRAGGAAGGPPRGPGPGRAAALDLDGRGVVGCSTVPTRPMFASKASPDVTFLRKDSADGGTYEVYHADTAEAAREFLLKKHVTAQFHYVVVETPEGNWGIDVQGLYLERLLPWQTDLSKAEVVGRPAQGLVSLGSARNAAFGYADNFIHGVLCGKCGCEWLDGLRLNRDTVVRCPRCREMNRVTSPSCHFVAGRE